MAHRILVVEDDGFTRMLLCSQLRELGHEVVGETANCAEGIASAAVTRPDVVLVDLDLGLGGWCFSSGFGVGPFGVGRWSEFGFDDL